MVSTAEDVRQWGFGVTGLSGGKAARAWSWWDRREGDSLEQAVRKNEILGLVFIATKKSRAMSTPLLKGEAEAWPGRVEICPQVCLLRQHPLPIFWELSFLGISWPVTVTPLVLPTKRQCSRTAQRLSQELCFCGRQMFPQNSPS